MKEVILEQLKKVEVDNEVKILFAIESGSRAWGFESKDSDYDVRFVYVHKRDCYLSLGKRRDVIELPIDDLLDINGWDLQKALKLFHKSNPALLEWVESPIVYIDGELRQELINLKERYFKQKSALYHYLSMAKKNYREYLKGDMVKIKKYFYVLRPLFACKWIEDNASPAPIEFDKLIDYMKLPKELMDKVDELLKMKRSGKEIDLQPRIDIVNEYIEEMIEYYSSYISKLGDIEGYEVEELDGLFKKYLVV